MAFIQHRHDQMHRGMVPPGQVASGTPAEGDVPTVQSDGSLAYEPGGGGSGAPTDVDYLVGTASGDLSAEIVVGTSPGGELGGTWASPTVDSTHSGSSHAGVQAAAEATAASALSGHTSDTSDAHDASAISVLDTGGNFTGTDVEAVLAELAGMSGGGHDLEDLHTDPSASGTVVLDRDDAPNHYLVLDGNLVLEATSSTYTADLLQMLVILDQDGTGGHLVDLSFFLWSDGEPTMPSGANERLMFPVYSMDDGTTWLAVTPGAGGGAGTPATTVESETAFGISPAVGTDTEYARQDHTHGTPADPVTAASVAAAGRWEPVQFDDGSSPWPFAYIDDEIVVAFIPA